MRRRTKFMAVLFALFILLVGTSSIFAQEASCTACHDDTTLITGMQTGLSESMHGTGHSYVRGTRSSCAGCHSGGAFSAMIAEGLAPNEVEAGDPNPTRQDCRACHQIHTSNTEADWALETTAPVALYAVDVTYNGGTGNLCVNCHQPRRTIAEPDAAGNIKVTSTHWGPHHGPQSAVMLGVGGAGITGSRSFHARIVKDTCVACHLGEDSSHTFEAVEICADCHKDTDGFDVNGVQTMVESLITRLGDRLVAKGLLDEEGHPIVGEYPAAQARALWNYILIAIEDGSRGVHNPDYTEALLRQALEEL